MNNEYEVGTYIDLSYQNERSRPVLPKSPETHAHTEVEVGTAYKIRKIASGFTLARRIPIVFA